MNTTKQLKFGSLFSGIGGFDLGFERAGMLCRWQVEIDPFAQKVLKKHWTNVGRWDDVRTFPPDPAEDWRVDVLCGGFPCKQTSNAAAIHGRRKGLEGVDSRLWWEMHRIINHLQPSRVIVENVAGVSTWADSIQRSLENSFFGVRRFTVTALGVGAPHLRRRMFFAADINRERLALTWQEESSEIEGEPWGASDRNPWLSSLPGVLRVDDGVPAGVDRNSRIDRLGNALVPQIAEWIGRRIVQHSGEKS